MKIADLTTPNPFKQFSDTYSLVYNDKFEEEAHQVVRGLTLSTHRKDRHYTLGNVNGHDIILLERVVDFHKPGREKISLKWAIMHTRLQIINNLPHIFLDGSNRYHEDIYEEIFTKFSKLVLASKPHQAPFMDAYRIFCNPETIPLLPALLPIEITNRLSPLGHEFDYEVIDNRIYVYAPMSVKSTKDIDKMFWALKTLSEWFESVPGDG